MTIREAAIALGAEILHDDFEDNVLSGAYTSDLLSDVMANANTGNKGSALITIQAHKNTVAVAAMLNISAILICNSRPVPEDMLLAAREERIALLQSGENQFTLSGKLFQMIIKGGS